MTRTKHAKGEERVVPATVLRKDLAKQLKKEAIRDAPEWDEEAGVIVVDDEGDLLTGEAQAASACRAFHAGDAEIDVLMVLDEDLGQRLFDAQVEFEAVLDEVLDEAERSET